MLVYAFSRKLPVQIIIAANKESVMGSEKRMDAHFGQNIWVGYSPVIRPEDYATFEAFWEHVRTNLQNFFHQKLSSKRSHPFQVQRPRLLLL